MRPPGGAWTTALRSLARATVTPALHVHRWGSSDAPPVVCLHGVTSWGGHFAGLAAALGESHRVVAPDLLGHGASPWEPPWRLVDQVEALLATLEDEPAAWLGHSFGARLALEVAASRPDRVESLVFLDPAVVLAPHVALWAAENARRERVYTSFEDALERRYEESQLEGASRELVEQELRAHLVESDDGWRYRYCQASVVTAHAELATPPPPFVPVRTLVVLGSSSYLPYDHFVDAHRAAIGDQLELVTVAGGHTVLWDAPAATAEAIAAFLADS